MNWPEILQSRMQITTGDGKLYDVLYKVESVKGSFDYNISEFHFPEVSGTKVDRRLRKGKRYPLEFFFQGENHIDQWNEFDASCSDKRPWQVFHPFYGLIQGEPISVGFDSSAIGVTRVEIMFVETILNGGPRTVLRPGENARAIVTLSRQRNETFFNSQITPTVSDVATMKEDVNALYESGSSSITDNDIAALYYNSFQKALSVINTTMTDTELAITFVNDFINYPAQFQITVKQRLDLLIKQIQTLYLKIDNLITPNDKKIFESQIGSLMTAVIDSAVTPLPGDYTNSVDVFFVIDLVVSTYNGFIDQLQDLQTENGFTEDSYLPDADLITSLDYAMNYTVSNLFEIALSAKQERVIYLEEDSNIVLLAHRFYGLLPDDSTIEYFANTNNIGISETLQVKKGRRIVYYV